MTRKRITPSNSQSTNTATSESLPTIEPVNASQPVLEPATTTNIKAGTDAVAHVFGSSSEKKITGIEKLDFIVNKVLDVNIDTEYLHLTEQLKIGSPGYSDRGTIQAAIDNAEDNARRAHQIYVKAKLIKEEYEYETKPIIASMLQQANEVLEDDKKTGIRTKQITDSDLQHKASAMFPDQWISQNKKLRAYDQTIKHLEQLSIIWNSRCVSLRNLIQTIR